MYRLVPALQSMFLPIRSHVFILQLSTPSTQIWFFGQIIVSSHVPAGQLIFPFEQILKISLYFLCFSHNFSFFLHELIRNQSWKAMFKVSFQNSYFPNYASSEHFILFFPIFNVILHNWIILILVKCIKRCNFICSICSSIPLGFCFCIEYTIGASAKT